MQISTHQEAFAGDTGAANAAVRPHDASGAMHPALASLGRILLVAGLTVVLGLGALLAVLLASEVIGL